MYCEMSKEGKVAFQNHKWMSIIFPGCGVGNCGAGGVEGAGCCNFLRYRQFFKRK